MIKLTSLINLAGVDLGNYKIHCAVDDNRGTWRPLDAYFAGTFEWGQSRQKNENFNRETVVSLINLSKSQKWLFVGVYEVGDHEWDATNNWYLYELRLAAGLSHLIGRVVVNFNKNFRACYLKGEEHDDSILVSHIREEPLSIADFPGFNSILLKFETLACVVRQDNISWRSALSSIGGVYVITDTLTGKQYVGSAYGGVGVWQRWSVYASTGHGGNKQLRALLNEKGNDYKLNFQFSLLEVCDINSGVDFIISRECHWKDILMTRKFGLN